MSGNTGNLGALNPLKHARSLMLALTLGLMLVCGTAYASPAEMGHPHPTQDVVDSTTSAGDLVFDGSIAFLVIVMLAFVSIGYWDSKQKGRQ